MRRLLLLLVLLLPVCAQAETAWVDVPAEVTAGSTTFAFTYDGAWADAQAISVYGETAAAQTGLTGEDGRGVFSAEGLAPGTYVLRLFSGDAMAQRQVTVVRPAILSLAAPDEMRDGWTARLEGNAEGEATVTDEAGHVLLRQQVWPGTALLSVPQGALTAGAHELTIVLRAGGVDSAPETLEVIVPPSADPAHDLVYRAPDDLSGIDCGHEVCYWKLNMGEMDEAAIWRVLTAPVTVLDGDERHQCKVRREPSSACVDYVGEVTYASQAVHVLERGEEWSLIEAYSSSVEGSSVAVWAKQFQGYVKTSLLRETQVSQKVGLVIDKLTQRLYVFRDGKLYSTLLCSTGYARADTPFNESPAGEFLAISWTGGFWSGSLYCDMAIRINDGILLHEVPCTISQREDGTSVRSYERCERYLGEKASHGCIRIQRVSSPEHVSAKWLWENLPRTGPKAKVIIWDDLGRQLGYPGDDLILYYNPSGGKNYHSSNVCAAVNEKYWPRLTPFRYAQLDEKPYSALTPCPACAPQLRHADIDVVNRKAR